MGETVTDIKRPFADVYKALDLKTQRKAMKSAMRREGNRLKKAAVDNLRSSGIGQGTKRSLSSGIYVRTYPDRYGMGFMVSVKPHGRRKGIHLNRQGKEKPVLMWAEDGTRYRKAGRRISSFFGKSRFTGKKVRQYLRGGANRGQMKRYAFLAKTEQQATGEVEANLSMTCKTTLKKRRENKDFCNIRKNDTEKNIIERWRYHSRHPSDRRGGEAKDKQDLPHRHRQSSASIHPVSTGSVRT